jgi:hypothetical protein
LENIRSFKSTNRRNKSLEVVHLANGENHLDPYLNVFNSLTVAMRKITSSLPLQELAKLVLADNKADTSRGNKFIDIGFSAEHNQKRRRRHGGVAIPNKLEKTPTQPDTIFHKALLGMTDLLDLVCQDDAKGKVFRDPLREALFAGTLVKGNRIEALRVALTNSDNVVSCHCDDKNDVSQNFEGVINFSKWLLLDGVWWRLSLIGYSRKSVAGCLRRIKLYKPLVARISNFYKAMPVERKLITPALLQPAKFSSCDEAYRLKPHANKCVFYSVFVDSLTRLQKHLHLSVWHVLALVTNTIVSETPDYFRFVSNHFLNLSGKHLQKIRAQGPTAFALNFYSRLFDEKDRRRTLHLKVPGQRHQPHYNTRQNDVVVLKSIANFFRLYQAFQHLDSKLASDRHFYGKAIANLEAGYQTTGVFGAGCLTAQHLIHIGALCGLFPPEMLLHAEIGITTNSYKYLRRWEGMTDHHEDTRQLLACVGHQCRTSEAVAENLICKYGQDLTQPPPPPLLVPNRPKPKAPPPSTTGQMTRKEKAYWADQSPVWTTKSSPYRDSIFKDQYLYDLDDDKKLVEVTASGVRTVEFLSSRCLSSVHKEPPVAFSYWRLKAKSKRPVSQMKGSTRKHLRRLMALPPASLSSNEMNRSVTEPRARLKIAESDDDSVADSDAHQEEDDQSYQDDDQLIMQFISLPANNCPPSFPNRKVGRPKKPLPPDMPDFNFDQLLDDNDSDADESDDDGSEMQANPPPSVPNRKLGRQTKKKSYMPDSNFVDAVHLLVHNDSDADDSEDDGSDDDGCDGYDESDEWLPRSGSRTTNIDIQRGRIEQHRESTDNVKKRTTDIDIQRRKIEQHRESTDNVKKRKKTNAPVTFAKAHAGNCRTGKISSKRARPGGVDAAVLHVDKMECKKQKRSPKSSTGKRSESAARTTFELPGEVECTSGVLGKSRKNTMVDDNIDSEVQTTRVEALYKRRLAAIAKRKVRLEEEDAALESSAGEYCKSWKRLDEFTQITWGEDDTSSDEEEWQEVNKGRFENLAVAKPIPLSISLSPIIPPTSISIPSSIRMPLKLEQAATKALHLPPFHNQFISRETFDRPARPGESHPTTMVASHFSYPSGPGRPNATWFPPSDLGSDIVAAFSPGSLLAPDGKRYHESRNIAATYLFVAAVLQGDAKFMGSVLAPQRCLQASVTLMVDKKRHDSLFDARPLGVITSHIDNNGFSFSFVNAQGLFIGPQLTTNT